MIRNPKEDIVFFNYIISHSPEDKSEDELIEYYKAKFIDLQKNLNDSERNDETFNSLFNDLKKKMLNC